MATFVVAMGFALLQTGIGFLVLTLRLFRQPSTAKNTDRRTSAATKPAIGAA